jgi:hypothetical protein
MQPQHLNLAVITNFDFKMNHPCCILRKINGTALSVSTQQFMYCIKQPHVSATEHCHQAAHKNEMEIFTVVWFEIS